MKIVQIRGLYPVCCFLCFLPYLAAQAVDAAADDQLFNNSVIRVNSSLVSVPVSATGTSGQRVPDLRIEDFRLTEDGRPAEISRLLESSSLNIALLFDVSGSVNFNFKFEQNAAIDFLKKIWKEGDAVTIISFDEQPEVRLTNGDNLQEAMWTLRQLRPTGKTTSFFDALILASRLIAQSAAEETRQAIIVISDGADNTSASNLASALSEMQRRNAVFYAINPSGAAVVRLNRVSSKGQENLETFAKATGGHVFVSDNAGDLESIFGKIVSELRAQYLLLYYSLVPDMDGKFHTIEVSTPKRPELNIRARPGFLAVPR
ncbi:MAG: VWA domain-containing protein [Acidobacteria bacterium]|nr:VWA domain-containing protein [Acidobacteriota bacterium]